jgi:hypothetical protein
MRSSALYIIAFSIYLLFLSGLVAVLVLMDDEVARLGAMSFLSTGLFFFTILFALFVARGRPSERYRELYSDEEEKKEMD